jgi:mannan polymerase II complex MNN11 subunit
MPLVRRNRAPIAAVLGVLLLLYLFLRSGGKPGDKIPSGTPPVVIVTVFEPERNNEMTERIKTNRRQYAEVRGA